MPDDKAVCDLERCDAFCCRYLSIRIGKPIRKEHFDEIRWYVAHKGTTVYCDDHDRWIVYIKKDCDWLDENLRCKSYDKRPLVCRQYGPDGCSMSINEISTKHVFKVPEDIDRYIAKRWPEKKKRKKR